VSLQTLEHSGIREIRFDGTLVDLEEMLHTRIDKTQPHTIEAVVARLEHKTPMTPTAAQEHVRRALDMGRGSLLALGVESVDERLFSASLHCAASLIFVVSPTLGFLQDEQADFFLCCTVHSVSSLKSSETSRTASRTSSVCN
jgi:excinuclease UvrABC ATPase subunit